MIRHIVLDIGRVLIQWDPERPFRRLIPDEGKRRWFLDNVCTSDWNREQDRGRSWADGEAVLIRQYPEYEDLIRAYRTHWPEMVPGEIAGSFALLRDLLSAGHDVTLLTNFHHETFALAQEMYPGLASTRGVTVSGAVGLLKPDREIYDHHARTFGLDPEATLFFDDTADNVAGARRAGWQARHFTTVDAMQRDLASVGLPLR